MSLKIRNNIIPGLITFPALIISIILGLSAFVLIISDIQINLPGTNLSTDPREIFVLISAALTGPIGGMISGALSSMYDPNKDIILYIVLQHMFAALWVSLGYKHFIFKNYSIPRLIGGWILIVLAYYYICYIPIYVISYFFFPNVYLIINNGQAPLWSSLFEHYKGWSYEIIFTAFYSLLVMLALPFRYCIPRWGAIDLTKIKQKKIAYFETLIKKIPFLNRIGVRAFTFFLLLSVIPLVGIGIFIKKDVTENLLDIEALYMKENAYKLSGLMQLKQTGQYPEILTAFNSPEDHFFIMDSNGKCIYHIKDRIITSEFCSFVRPSILFEILTVKNGLLIDKPNNKTYGFHEIKGKDEIIVYHSSEKNINDKIPELQSKSINKLFISFLIIYLISGFVIWIVIARPIKVFKKAADEISEGNYSINIKEEEFDDEINSLASSFKQMTKNIIKNTNDLLERDFLLKTVVTNTPVVHFIVDPNGIFRLSIGKGLASLGLYENQVVGLSVYDVYKDFPDIVELINMGFKGETSQKILLVNNHYFDTKVIPSFNNKNELQSIIGIATEITDIMKYEKQIVESEHKYRLLAENSTDVISIFSVDGIVKYMSPQCYNLTGYIPEEMYGNFIANYIFPEDLLLLRKSLEEILKEKNKISNIVFRFVKKDGTLIWVETSSKKVLGEGDEHEIQSSTRDISERKNMEQELRAALDRAEESDTLKTNLLANMSHELRTPMNGILGLASILHEGSCSERQANMLSKIILSGKRLMNTLNSVLDLTQIESGIIKPNLKEVSLSDCVNNALSQYPKRAKENNLDFEIELPAYDIICMLDERIFGQIIAYLVDNAIKFTVNGGIKVIAGEENIDGSFYCYVKIKDTGIGIAQNHLAMIFEEFKQVSEGYGRSFEGLGLGLTNAKKMTTLLDGTILVESRQGSGSTFTLQFKSLKHGHKNSRELFADHSLQEPKAIESDTKRILIVEDNELNIEVIKSFLIEYDSDTATNGEDAISLSSKNSYSIILMDINLKHNMTGIEAMKKIRKLKNYNKTPILAITGFAMIGDREKLLAEGFDDYLQKPFNSYELNEIVKKYI